MDCAVCGNQISSSLELGGRVTCNDECQEHLFSSCDRELRAYEIEGANNLIIENAPGGDSRAG